MSRQRWINATYIVVFLLIVLLFGWQPTLLLQLPLSKTDKKLIEDTVAFSQEILTQPTVVAPTFSYLSVDGNGNKVSSESSSLLASSSALQQPSAIVIKKPLATESAIVKRVVDGDTIELEDGRVVRYIGIDTPETKHPTKGVQCFGREASAFNTQLVTGKSILLEKDVSNVDRYGRLLRYVWLDGKLINWQLVAEGYAFASSYPPDIARQTDFTAAEKLARQNLLGLWASCN